MALQVWLPLNGDIHNQGLNQNIIPSGLGTVSYDNSGKIGKCFISGGTSQVTNGISLNNNFVDIFNNPNGCSIAVWIKPVGNHFHYNGTVVSSGNWNSQCWSFGVSQDNTKVDALCKGYNAYISCNIPVNEWTHLVGVFKDGISKVYKNGIYVGQLTGRVAFDSDYSNTCIGRETYASGYFGFNGRINDVRIYDHALSDKEIKEISKGLVLHYKLDKYTKTSNGFFIPNEVELYDYIEGNGTSTYLDTLVNPRIKPRVVADLTIINSADKDYWGNSAKNGSAYYADFSGYRIAYYRYGSTSAIDCGNAVLVNTRHIYDVSDKVYLDGVLIKTITNVYTYDSTQSTIQIFKAARSSYYSDYKLHDFKLYDGDVLVRHLLPCTYSGEPGMWDIIENKFYGNQGTGTFTLGTQFTSSSSLVYDCSGYGNHGIPSGQINIEVNTPRYNNSIKYLNSATAIGIGNLSTLLPEKIFTFNIWFKKITSEWSTKTWETILGGPSGFELEAKLSSTTNAYIHPYNWGGGSTSSPNTYSIQYELDTWNMLTMVKTLSNTKFYLNGELKVTGSVGSIPSGDYFIGAWQTAIKQNYRGCLSDARIYCTALSDQDILELYHNPTNIDNQGNMFTFEFDEEETSKQRILQTGITKIDNFVEIMDKIKVLDDGSVFLQILHHNNPASNLFTVSNCWLNNTENLYSALILLKNIFKNLTEYEFLACEKLTSSGTEVQFRWSQTSNPALSSTITGKTIISGSVTHNEGLKTTGSYAVMHNGSTWWCACGSYTAYQGGIPGFNGVIKSGYLDLYIRIPEDVLKGNIGNFAKFFKKSILSTQFIEK